MSSEQPTGSSIAESSFDAALANALEEDELLEGIKNSSFSEALTIYYKDGLGNIGRGRIAAPREDSSLDNRLLFFSFSPEDPEDGTPATRVILETVFLKDTYREQWFICDPKL